MLHPIIDVNLLKTKMMTFGHNTRELIQKVFYIGNNQIEITHEYKYIGLISNHVVPLSHKIKGGELQI